jgi:lipopolysaccharide transport system ATP-binding protein
MAHEGEVLIQVDGVGKRFCRDLKRSLWYGMKDIASDCFAGSQASASLRKDEFWALKDVSFQLRRGECLGLIGANGAGKTTLLRILNGLIKPDSGEVRIRGRVGALIALGAGFNPVLTGRENIYVNAAVLGLSKKETDAQLEAIIAFADIGPAIDAPVQTYSSGMTVRLGFAVAAHLEPDILLIDEVLAVGDAAFRYKCFAQINKLLQRSTAIILVSHNQNNLLRVGTHGIVLENGVPTYSGPIEDCIHEYADPGIHSDKAQLMSDSLLGIPEIQYSWENAQDSLLLKLSICFEFKTEIHPRVLVKLYNSSNTEVCGLTSKNVDQLQAAKSHKLDISINCSSLFSGKYQYEVFIFDNADETLIFQKASNDCLNLNTQPALPIGRSASGLVELQHQWEVR